MILKSPTHYPYSFLFTYAEKTQKKYTVQDAINAAKTIIFQKHKHKNISTNPLRKLGIEPDDKITLLELNYVSDKLVDDTLYWEGGYYF